MRPSPSCPSGATRSRAPSNRGPRSSLKEGEGGSGSGEKNRWKRNQLEEDVIGHDEPGLPCVDRCGHDVDVEGAGQSQSPEAGIHPAGEDGMEKKKSIAQSQL